MICLEDKYPIYTRDVNQANDNFLPTVYNNGWGFVGFIGD